MKKIFNTLCIIVVCISCQSNISTDPINSNEKPKEEVLQMGSKFIFKSKVLNEDRPILVSLPKGYEDSKGKYPVLYLTDGLQNIWHVMGSIEVLTRTGSIPPIIVVGIESTNRRRDFTFTPNENNPGSGGGKMFLDFISSELIPYINTNYKTNSFKVIEGHSLGGLFAASTLLEKPNLFDGYIVMSPALWWNGEELSKKAKSFFSSHPDLDKSLFFGIGTYESGADFGMRKELKNFTDLLSENQPKNLRFERKEMEKEGHMSSPLLSNYYGLKFIFSDMEMPDSLFTNYTNEGFLKHESKIMSKYGIEAKQSAESYVQLAAYLINKNRLPDAITVLKRSVEAYPFDVGLLNFLANTYEKNKDIESAIASYTEAIKISETYNYGREDEFKDQIKRLENN